MTESATPIINALNRPFWGAAAEGVLALPHCLATGQAFWPPSPISPFPEGGAVEWRTVDPVGLLVCRVIYHRGFQAAFKHLLPYAVGLVELSSGPRLQVHIRQADEPTLIEVGTPIRLSFGDILSGGDLVLLGDRINMV
jgi:uncharacterized OB-fold protein